MYLLVAEEEDVIVYGDSPDIITMHNTCILKYLADGAYNLILLNVSISDEGIIEKYNIVLDEIFIALKIKIVITNCKCDKLKEICDYYNVVLIEYQ